MFDNLTQRFSDAIGRIVGSRLTESNIHETVREIRRALLEADVALPAVKDFIERIESKAVGEKIIKSLSPGQVLIKLVHDELVKTLGEANAPLELKTTPPAVILLVGLQGTGKTTTAAKLAAFLKARLKKSVLLSSTDIYRPAAIEQLSILANQYHFPFYEVEKNEKDAVKLAGYALDYAKQKFLDSVIMDTAGRLHIDDKMMKELQQIHQKVRPIETLLVIDSMMGQDAVNTAKVFGDALPITGVILTKTDGDARGGAALSVWHVLNRPIKFIGTGEKIDALDVFYPDRAASRILGMGDVISLVEETQRTIDQKKARKLAKKIKKGKGFDLQDFLEQLEQMEKMGGMGSLMAKLPGMHKLPAALKSQVNDKQFLQMKAMIQSMTPKERYFPDLIKASRKKRIANGSGTQIQDVNRLLKQFSQMEKVLKRLSKMGGLSKLMKMAGNLGGLGSMMNGF